jgi:hypothetical protein
MSNLVRTAQGAVIDMNDLITKNDQSIAVTGGGISMNARGDILGPGGKIITKREDLELAYNKEDPHATKSISVKDIGIANPPKLNRPHIDAVQEEMPIQEISLEEASRLADSQLGELNKRKRKTTI